MRVYVKHWAGGDLPKEYVEGVREVSAQDILALFEMGYDVMLSHQPNKRFVLGHDLPILFLDATGKRFKTR